MKHLRFMVLFMVLTVSALAVSAQDVRLTIWADDTRAPISGRVGGTI